MKFIAKVNLSYSYIILFVAASLLASCESRRRRSHHMVAGADGAACTKGRDCDEGLVCRQKDDCKPRANYRDDCPKFCQKPLGTLTVRLDDLCFDPNVLTQTHLQKCPEGLVCRTKVATDPKKYCLHARRRRF